MLPITRANLQSFCRNCLREFTTTETIHNLEQSQIQHNRLFPQKICHCCYIKIKTLKGFQDRANLATGVMKLIVEERLKDKNDKSEIETLERRLQMFCRLCLKSNSKPVELVEAHIFNDIEDCTGLKIDQTPTKLEYNSHPLSDDAHYSHAICVRCQSTLKSFVEYRQVAKQTIDYLQSILDDEDDDDEDISRNHPAISTAECSQLPNTVITSTEVESVELPCMSFNSKFSENEQTSEKEDDFNSRESLFDNKLDKRQKNLDKRRTSKPTKSVREGDNAQRPREIDHVRRKRQPRFANEEPKVYEVKLEDSLKTNEVLHEIMITAQNEELQGERKFEIFEIEPNMQREACNETENEFVAERTQLTNTIFKKELDEELIKKENSGDQENYFSTVRKTHGTSKNTNPILCLKNSDENIIFPDSKATKSMKQETDTDTDAYYEIGGTGSDSSSDNICLAKLFSNKKEATDLKKTKTKAKRKIHRTSKSFKDSTKVKYKCEHCKKCFFKKHTMEAHIKRHEGAAKPFICKQCELSFTTYQALQRHEYFHNQKGKKLKKHQSIRMRYKSSRECLNCQLVLTSHLDLADHIRKEHNGVYIFKCKICGKCLSTRQALERHEKNHSDLRPFACQFCEKRYNYETELRVHMQRHTADPNLLCPICKTARADPDDLQKHIESHSRPHQCFKCGKVFTKAYNLHQHDISVHLKLKVHKCPQCGMGFKGAKTLALHRLHHDPTGRPETCRVCGLHFRTRRGRLRHTSKFHPNVELPSEGIPIAADDARTECCEKCPLRFKTKRGLMLHTKKTHERGQRVAKTENELREKYGDRSEVCELCQLQCFSKKGLSRHIRKSHPELAEAKDQEKTANCSEACNVCPLKFKTARGLLLHRKRMHRDMAASQDLKKLSTKDDEERKLSSSLNLDLGF